VKHAFVLGHPITHSRSPLIHGHWLKSYGIRGRYDAIDVAPDEMEAFFQRIRAGEFIGGNVTVPLKEIADRLVDTHDLDTIHIGATNTLTTYPGPEGLLIHGTNTDHYGFLANLDEKAPGWSDGARSAIVLGAGGAARAVVSALLARAIPAIHILNRTAGKAADLAHEFTGWAGAAHGGALSDFAALAGEAALVVNTTTIGMHGTRFDPPLPLELLPKAALVTDLVYVPLVTPLLADARALGLRTVDGLGMLLHQAVPGFEAWFGTRPEVTPELRALIEATLR
jgi:shikimate dehydrogenase